MNTIKNWIKVGKGGVVLDFLNSYESEEIGFEVFDGELPADLDVGTHRLAGGVLIKIEG